MNILERIIADKRKHLERLKELLPLDIPKDVNKPENRFFYALKRVNNSNINLIAELKKASPSKGVIRPNFNPEEILKVYSENRFVKAISILTEDKYFQGRYRYLRLARKITDKPILMKDFIFDEYQLLLGYYLGADAILMITAVFTDILEDVKRLEELLGLAEYLHLDVLLENHSKEELDIALDLVNRKRLKIIGINNRNLKTFEVKLETTVELLKYISNDIRRDIVVVGESGIKGWEDVKLLEECGVDAILVGESIMRSGDINKAIDMLFQYV